MRARPSFELYASDRLTQDLPEIVDRWIAGIDDIVGVDPRRAGSDALDGAALERTVGRIAGFLLDGDGACFESDETGATLVLLGAWCARRGTDGQVIVEAFDRLAALLDGACLAWMRAMPVEPHADEVLRVAGRLNRAPILMAARAVAGLELEGTAQLPGGDFTELLAHELATPLNAAEVAAVLLENDRVTPGSQDLRRLAGQIQRNLRRVRALIGDARDLSFASAPGRQGDHVGPIDVLLGELITQLMPMAREAGVRVDVEEPVPPLRVPAACVSLVLRNLISNAIKYADPDSDPRWVRVSFEPCIADGGWVIAVSDNGLGIPAEHQSRIFQRFVRLHPERADGTGLGLAIAAETARRMNGRLEFVSEPGVGSTFRFVAPAVPAATQPQPS